MQVFVAKDQELAAVPSAPGGFAGEEPQAKAFSSCFGAMKRSFGWSLVKGSSGLGMPALGGFAACFEPSLKSSRGPGWVLGSPRQPEPQQPRGDAGFGWSRQENPVGGAGKRRVPGLGCSRRPVSL